MKKSTFIILFSFLSFHFVFAQNDSAQVNIEQRLDKIEKAISKRNKLNVSGYIQAQFQHGERDASLDVGGKNENSEHSFSRVGVRRGRVKLTYEEKILSGVFQLDLTEKGISVKDVYLNVKDPWLKSNALRAGLFLSPFGAENNYSSSTRESPERSNIFRTLFPDEYNFGAMLSLQAPQSSNWSILKLDFAAISGNASKIEIDSRIDIIGRLTAKKKLNNQFSLSGGISYYNGSSYQGNDSIYKMKENAFVLNEYNNKGKYAKREYFGVDIQSELSTSLGKSSLRAEYLFGSQPSVEDNSRTMNNSSLPIYHTYIRSFRGGYAMFSQTIGKLPLAASVRYDWYDPNIDVSGSQAGINGTSSADLSKQTLGFGLIWDAMKSLRLMAYYEIVKNETSENSPSFQQDREDNVFTMRLQYKF